MSLSAYEELVERCEGVGMNELCEPDIPGILAEVLRTLETVTLEMWNAGSEAAESKEAIWLAMLHASPLEPPK